MSTCPNSSDNNDSLMGCFSGILVGILVFGSVGGVAALLGKAFGPFTDADLGRYSIIALVVYAIYWYNRAKRERKEKVDGLIHGIEEAKKRGNDLLAYEMEKELRKIARDG